MGTQFIEVPIDVIRECKTLRQALRLCWRVSGLDLKELSDGIGIEFKSLSRMLSPNEQDPRHFPPEKIVLLMEACGNVVPLRWLADQMGEGNAAELRAELAHERTLFLQLVHQIRYAPPRVPRLKRAMYSIFQEAA